MLAVVAVPASAEIYRCSDGETIVFSDVPCSASAKVHDTGQRVSVVNSADDLDEIAASNKAFLDRRREALAQQRERAAQQRREAQRRQRRLEAIEQAQRTRTVVGHLGNSRFGRLPNTTPDPRNQSRRQPPEDDDEQGRRRALLSRSAENRDRGRIIN